MPTNQQDVKVRISAEGIAEVVEAFKKISESAKESGKEGSAGLELLNEQFSELGKKLLGGFALAELSSKFGEMVKSTLETAEGLQRLSAQTGISTSAIQALQRAARETGLSADVANAGIQKFSVAVGKAEIGSKQSLSAIHDLGISVKEISTGTPDEKLLKVATALAKIEDPARRSRDEMALFGKAGAQLDQSLIKIGTEGIDPFVAKLKELGLYLSDDDINATKEAGEKFKDLGDKVKGAATQITIGLIPALSQAADSLLKATTGDGANGLRQVGELVGKAFQYVVNALEHTGNNVAALIVKTQIFFASLRDQAANIFNPAEVKRLAQQSAAAIAEVQAENERRNAAADARLDEKPPAAEKPEARAGGGEGGLTDSQRDALAKARYALLQTQLDNELKLYETHNKLQTDIAENQYKQGLISLTDYYAQRAAIINADFDKRIATAQAKARAQAALPVADDGSGVAAIQAQQQQAKLQGEIADLQAQRTEALKASTNELANAQAALDDKTIKAQETLLTLEGKRTAAAELRLATELKSLNAELQQGGASQEDRTGVLSNAAQQGQAKIDFDDTQQKANAALSQLKSQTDAINDSVKSGQIFSIAGQQQIIQLDMQRLPLLQQQAQEMLAIAKASGDPTLIAQAQAFNQKIQEIATSTNQAGQQMAILRQGVESAVGAGLNTFFNDALKGSKNLKTTFKDTALSIVSDLERIAEKALEQQILKSIFGTASGSGGGSGSTGLIGGAVAAFAGSFASGGLIRGPGTSTSDSVPIAASNGEFVVNAKTTAQPGVLPLLHAINGGKLRSTGGTGVPKYAQGGVVSGAPAGGSHKIVNVLDPSTLGDHLQTDAGETAVLNIISRNPTRIRNSIS